MTDFSSGIKNIPPAYPLKPVQPVRKEREPGRRKKPSDKRPDDGENEPPDAEQKPIIDEHVCCRISKTCCCTS